MSHDVRRLEIDLTTQLAASLPPISGDRIQLEQLLVNLLKNGCEAMEQTPVAQRHLIVRTTARTGMVEVLICDSGTGIPAEQLDRLFEPFYTTKAEGMGMGLAISKSITESHDIEMHFQNNEDGPGLSVRLLIPAESPK